MIKKIKHYLLILTTSYMLGIANILRDEDKMVADFFEHEPIVEIYNTDLTSTFANFEFQNSIFKITKPITINT